jgi:hypothetical protein
MDTDLVFICTGDSMLDTAASGHTNSELSGMQFSTYDQDNHLGVSVSCAEVFIGGWWFNWCHDAFLNGRWSSGKWVFAWFPTVFTGDDIKETKMMLKHH